MSVFRVGLVTEGLTDQIVMKTFLHKHFSLSAPNVTLTFVNLQPSVDATSGSPEGGWQMVYKWCLNNPPRPRIGQFFSSELFADDLTDKVCDVIVIHMDADICDQIGDKSGSRSVPTSSSSPEERGNFIEEVLNEWLWPEMADKDDRHIPAPAVEAIEAWLVAGLENEASAESLDQIDLHLARSDYRRRNVVPPPTIKKLRKSAHRYQAIADAACLNLGNVSSNCSWFVKLVSKLSPHIIASP